MSSEANSCKNEQSFSFQSQNQGGSDKIIFKEAQKLDEMTVDENQDHYSITDLVGCCDKGQVFHQPNEDTKNFENFQYLDTNFEGDFLDKTIQDLKILD